MKDLSLEPTIDNTDLNYLNGKVKDNQTKPTEHIFQDLIQTFEKIKEISSVVPNNLFDNEINTYQLLEALRIYIGRQGYVPRGNTTGDSDIIIPTPSNGDYDYDMKPYYKFGRDSEMTSLLIRVILIPELGFEDTAAGLLTITKGGDHDSTDYSLISLNGTGLVSSEFIVPVNANGEIGLRFQFMSDVANALLKVRGYFYGRII